jgi:hypothetical protein
LNDKNIFRYVLADGVKQHHVVVPRDALTNVPIRPMDVVVVPYFKVGLAFTVIDIIPFNGNHDYVGSSAFMVSTNTKFEIIY